MAFTDPYTANPEQIGSGVTTEAYTFNALATTNFQDGITVGRFAQLKAGVLSDMDATATPTVAGVVKREARYPITTDSTIATGIGAP